MEISVTAKKWVWQFEYPGRDAHAQRTSRAGEPARATRDDSEDVIHSFFVPAFRVKQDVVPGRYTELWFNAIEPGRYQVFCAEYCGKGHSDMLAQDLRRRRSRVRAG